MKRKVKKFAGDDESLVKGTTNVRTRTDAEFAEDSKYGGYGRYMPKTKEYTLDEAKEKLSSLFGGKSKAKEEAAPAEDRPRAKSSFGYEDMDGRMPAESTWSGDQSPKAKAKAAPEPEPEAPKAKAEGPFSGKADPDFESKREVKRGESDADKPKKDSGTKAKKAKRPSNPDAPAYDTSGNERRSGDSQSFAPPPRSGMGPKNTFLTKDRSDAAKKSMSKGFSMGLFERGDLGIGKKKGGAVKSASARADGCAIRGKTRA
jgi:hypothetical protein